VRRHEILREIESALADLPPAYAATFQLRICESFSYREIGEMLGEPEGTLRSRVHHALRRVRAALEAQEIEEVGALERPEGEEARRDASEDR
jgi:RNA polymerase sigma-70 factor (ECF subfamily)